MLDDVTLGDIASVEDEVADDELGLRAICRCRRDGRGRCRLCEDGRSRDGENDGEARGQVTTHGSNSVGVSRGRWPDFNNSNGARM